MSGVDDRLRLAVKNNAQWCDLVCRAAGIATTWQTEFWVAGRSTPRFYPEAITLQPNLAPAELIAALPAGRCSIKDSFADLGLGDDGFRELFTARWFYRDPSTDPAASDWTGHPHGVGLRGMAHDMGVSRGAGAQSG
jgi:hypothetical protein